MNGHKFYKAEDLISVVVPVILIGFPLLITQWGAVRASTTTPAFAQNTPFMAASFVLLGLAFIFFRYAEISKLRRRTTQVISAGIFIAGAIALIGHTRYKASMPAQAIFGHAASNMPLTAAALFVLASITIAMLTATRWRRRMTLAKIGAVATIIVSATAIASYAVGHPGFFHIEHLANMSPQTALLFIIASFNALRLSRIKPTEVTRSAGFISMAFVVVLLAGMVVSSISEYRRLQDEIDKTTAITSQTQEITSEIERAEGAQRDFLITYNTSYLEPFNTAMSQRQAQLTKLAGLVKDNQQQEKNVEQFGAVINQELGGLQYSLDLRREQGFWAAAAVINTNKGQVAMTKIAEYSKNIQQTATHELNAQQNQQEETNHRTIIALFIGTAINIFLLASMYLRSMRENHRRNLAEARLRTEKDDALAARAKDDAILSSIGDGVMALDAQGYVMLFNNAASDITGVAQADAIGKPYESVVQFKTCDGKRRRDQFIRHALHGNTEKDPWHATLLQQDGNLLQVTGTTAPITDAHDVHQGVIAVFRPVVDTPKG